MSCYEPDGGLMVSEILGGSGAPGPGESNLNYYNKYLHCTASAFTKALPNRQGASRQRTQCGKVMKTLIRVCEAGGGVNLTIAFSWRRKGGRFRKVKCIKAQIESP